MNHKIFEEELSAYVDNELSEDNAKKVRAHIEGCAACQKQLQVLRSIRSSIREAASVVLPETFVYSVQRAVRQQEQEYVQWLGPERFARNLVAALCIIVVALVAVGNYVTPQSGAGQPVVVREDRYFTGEPLDSAAHTVILSQREISKDDVMIAALSR